MRKLPPSGPNGQIMQFFCQVEYPIWVSMKRTFTGRLVLDDYNLIYCIIFKENVPKHLKIACENSQFWMVIHYTLSVSDLIGFDIT